MMPRARDSLQVLGRTIGTYSGWDNTDDNSMVFYEFEPCNVLIDELPKGDLNTNYDTGYFIYLTNDGEVEKKFDMLPLLSMVARDPE